MDQFHCFRISEQLRLIMNSSVKKFTVRSFILTTVILNTLMSHFIHIPRVTKTT